MIEMTDNEFREGAMKLFNECESDRLKLMLIFKFVVQLMSMVKRVGDQQGVSFKDF